MKEIGSKKRFMKKKDDVKPLDDDILKKFF